MWRFVIARARGTSHIKAGLPCQDQLDCRVVENQTLVAALADGAGSAVWAECGANIAVKAAVDLVSCQLDGDRSDYDAILREAAVEARETVLAETRRRGANPRDFASTLLVAVVGPDSGSALQIGDGAIVVSDGGQGWGWALNANQIPSLNLSTTKFRWIFWPQRGEYANMTRFLTDADALECLRIVPRLGKVTDIALMTDGLEPLALHYASTSVYEPFFRGTFRPLKDAEEAAVSESREIRYLSASLDRFLSSDRVRSRTDDDMSLVLATYRR